MKVQKREKWVKIHSIEQMAVEVPKVIDPLASNLSAGAYERHRMDLGGADDCQDEDDDGLSPFVS